MGTRVLRLRLQSDSSYEAQDSDSSQRARDSDLTWTRDLLDSDLAKVGLVATLVVCDYPRHQQYIYLYSLQSSANINRSEPRDLARSFIKIIKSNRLKMLPCDVPPRGGTRHELGGLNP